MTEISKTTPSEDRDDKTGRGGTFLKEVRCAVRFPLSLPVELSEDQSHDSPAVTRNVSANGVLLELSGPLNVGDELDFNLRMPGSVLGTPQDVLVHCRGRVVRCSISQSHYQAAATIDEYHFVEQ
jgi:PilZ domain